MNDLIERNAVLEVLCNYCGVEGCCPEGGCAEYRKISQLPTVEVVRCKECRYYNEDGEYCGMWGSCRHPEHFCDEGVKDNG